VNCSLFGSERSVGLVVVECIVVEAIPILENIPKGFKIGADTALVIVELGIDDAKPKREQTIREAIYPEDLILVKAMGVEKVNPLLIRAKLIIGNCLAAHVNLQRKEEQ
jgi:hypothetical protein